MSSKPKQQDDQRVARVLGLKVPVYRRLRDALDQGESLAWLRLADPGLAGVFPNPLGFELLIEHLEVEVALERRRANFLRNLEGKELPELVEAVRGAGSEGELEDLHLELDASPAPDGGEAPEKEEHQAFLAGLRGDAGLAAGLRKLFREKAEVRVEIAEGKEQEARRFQSQAEKSQALSSFPAGNYLALRRAEHAHLLKVHFELPRPELDRVFDAEVKNAPPQERDSYLKLFADFFAAERLPRLVQEARARLKRAAESLALQQSWEHIENALDRGKHDGPVLGVFSLRNGKCILALLDKEGHFLRGTSVSAKAEDLAEKLTAFLGEEKPGLIALQADSPTRSHGGAVVDAVRAAAAGKVRTVLVPVAVAKTLLREVARRLEEAHLSHDERQATLIARIGHHPRAMALHTPHIVRSYVAFRGEINSRRLDAFESIFLQSMLSNRGVDLNLGNHDELRLVPGVDARAVEAERSTAPFMSLEDFQHRMGLPEREWRGACCFLRSRTGAEPLDARPLHPVYYRPLRLAAEAAGVDLVELLKEPAKVGSLDWEAVLKERGWGPKVVDQIRRGLMKGGRRPRRTPAGPLPGRPLGGPRGRRQAARQGHQAGRARRLRRRRRPPRRLRPRLRAGGPLRQGAGRGGPGGPGGHGPRALDRPREAALPLVDARARRASGARQGSRQGARPRAGPPQRAARAAASGPRPQHPAQEPAPQRPARSARRPPQGGEDRHRQGPAGRSAGGIRPDEPVLPVLPGEEGGD